MSDNPFAPPSAECQECRTCERRRNWDARFENTFAAAFVLSCALVYGALIVFGIYGMYVLVSGGGWGVAILVSVTWFFLGFLSGTSVRNG